MQFPTLQLRLHIVKEKGSPSSQVFDCKTEGSFRIIVRGKDVGRGWGDICWTTKARGIGRFRQLLRVWSRPDGKQLRNSRLIFRDSSFAA